MARINGPLFSLNASGNWARGALQFRGGLQATHAYRPAPPKSVNQKQATPAQATVRQRYQDALVSWTALTEPERAPWSQQAEPLGLSGWNLYAKNIFDAASAAQTINIAIMIGTPPLSTDLASDPNRPIAGRRLSFIRFLP